MKPALSKEEENPVKTRFNWPAWLAFLLSVITFLSYPLLFVRFPTTRDVPWANLLLLGITLIFLVMGIRRAFARERMHPTRSKIVGSLLATLSIVVLGLFVFSIFIAARWMPASLGAPKVGQKAPDFVLPDSDGNSVSLAELLSKPINGSQPKGVLLIFYRGYW